jgi:hypothetical protein
MHRSAPTRSGSALPIAVWSPACRRRRGLPSTAARWRTSTCNQRRCSMNSPAAQNSPSVDRPSRARLGPTTLRLRLRIPDPEQLRASVAAVGSWAEAVHRDVGVSDPHLGRPSTTRHPRRAPRTTSVSPRRSQFYGGLRRTAPSGAPWVLHPCRWRIHARWRPLFLPRRLQRYLVDRQVGSEPLIPSTVSPGPVANSANPPIRSRTGRRLRLPY